MLSLQIIYIKKKMESNISKTLYFNFLIPTSYSFYEILSKKIGIDKDLCHYQFGKYLTKVF